MMFNHTIHTAINFDRNAYSIKRPLGTWKAKIDRAVHNQGSRTNPSQGGKRTGIHLYVEHENGQKIWLFIPLLPGFDLLTVTHNFRTGDFIEVEIATSKSGLPAVRTLRKLDRSIRLLGKKSCQKP